MIYWDKHVKLAMNMAHKSTSKFRLGAVVAKRANAISTGYNDMSRKHPIMLDRRYNPKRVDKSLHAEVDACIGLTDSEMEGSDLYVARVLKNGNPAMAKPCKICQRFLITMRFKRVYYTTASGVEMLLL